MFADIADKLRQSGFDLGLVEKVRNTLKISLHPAAIRAIAMEIANRGGCKLLVFGLGNDSALWEALNLGGRTTFLEDDAEWYQHVVSRNPEIEAYLVSYESEAKDWKWQLRNPWANSFELPEGIVGKGWDVILVDGPAGYREATPGRSKTIYAASVLAAGGGVVFVDDCDRDLEAAFVAEYFEGQHLEVDSDNHVTRQWKISTGVGSRGVYLQPGEAPLSANRELFLKILGLVRVFAVRRMLLVGENLGGLMNVVSAFAPSVGLVDLHETLPEGAEKRMSMIIAQANDLSQSLLWAKGQVFSQDPLIVIADPHGILRPDLYSEKEFTAVYGDPSARAVSTLSVNSGRGHYFFVIPRRRIR